MEGGRDTSVVTPLERVFRMALQRNGLTVAALAAQLEMAPTNLSLARHSRRRMPMTALLTMMDLARLSAAEKIKVIEWITFEQVISR